jgi:hypothetical protein
VKDREMLHSFYFIYEIGRTLRNQSVSVYYHSPFTVNSTRTINTAFFHV